MYKDQILTLDNGLEYLVINEFDYNNRRFILGAMIDTQNDLIDEEDLFVKEVINDNGEDRIITIEDPRVLDTVSKFILTKASMEA